MSFDRQRPEPVSASLDKPAISELSPSDRMVLDKRAIYDGAVQVLSNSVEGYIKKMKTTDYPDDPNDGMFDWIQGYSMRGREITVLNGDIPVARAADADNVLEQLRGGDARLTVESWFEGDGSAAEWSLDYRFDGREDPERPAVIERRQLKIEFDAQSLPAEVREMFGDALEALATDTPDVDLGAGRWKISFLQMGTPSAEQLIGLSHEVSSAQRAGSSRCLPSNLDNYGYDILFGSDDVGVKISFSPTFKKNGYSLERVATFAEMGELSTLINGSRSLGALIRETEIRAMQIHDIEPGPEWRDVV